MFDKKGTEAQTGQGQKYIVYNDLPYLPDGDALQCLDFYIPDKKAPEGGWPLVVYAHPGGFTQGDKSDASRFAINALDHGFAMASVNYRLLGNNPESIAQELADVQAAMDWLVDNAAELGINTKQLAYAGVSAGGALTSAAAVRANNQNKPELFGVISIISPYDIPNTADYLDESDPPFFMVHGKMDSIVDFSQAERFTAALDAMAIPYVLETVGDIDNPVDHFDVLNVYKEQGKGDNPFIWLKGLLG
ncbi:MAG: alpha/beta hydrolase [Eubacteriaceae bacterium]|nr:alpha/beta hydrolase [Eubacteriaceae bacterium]